MCLFFGDVTSGKDVLFFWLDDARQKQHAVARQSQGAKVEALCVPFLYLYLISNLDTYLKKTHLPVCILASAISFSFDSVFIQRFLIQHDPLTLLLLFGHFMRINFFRILQDWHA